MKSNYFSLLDLHARKDNLSAQTMAEGNGSRTGDPSRPRGMSGGGPSQEGGGEQVAKGLVAAGGGGWDGLRGGGRNMKRFCSASRLAGAGDFSPDSSPPPHTHTP